MLTGATRLVGLVGNPVSRSLSPRMQNAAFAARGLDWAYVPLPVEAAALEAALTGLAALGFAGANVTVPHKTTAVAYCDELDEFAERAGSLNTIVVRDGRLAGSSTDGVAVTEAVDASGAAVLLLGAGGAAQAVATALADAGAARLVVASRRPDAAAALAARLRALFPGPAVAVDETWPPAAAADIVVNATPVWDRTLVPVQAHQRVVDLAYRSDGEPTALVAAAREAACALVVDGLEILMRQGAASFERWTGVPAPRAVMRAALPSAP
ncbi:MAG TPA: NAD(P)-binding domain-containing protein [Gaiellaceae bacterium]|nr:NAD(P)-binding domain-containing protein [Gaiellaceae bacterium]